MSKYTTHVGNVDGKSNSVTLNLPVASAVTVTAGDFVYFASGRITSATIAGARLIGQVQETKTGNAGGTVKALVVVDPDAKYLVQASAALAASTVGQYYPLQGATGVQLVNQGSPSATAGALLLLEANPQISPVQTDTTYGLFKIVDHYFLKSA